MRLNLNFASKPQCGNFLPINCQNGTWNGLVGELVEENTDIGWAAFYLKIDRQTDYILTGRQANKLLGGQNSTSRLPGRQIKQLTFQVVDRLTRITRVIVKLTEKNFLEQIFRHKPASTQISQSDCQTQLLSTFTPCSSFLLEIFFH